MMTRSILPFGGLGAPRESHPSPVHVEEYSPEYKFFFSVSSGLGTRNLNI